MFGLSNILDSLDSAAKDTLQEGSAPSATWLRSQRKASNNSSLREQESDLKLKDSRLNLNAYAQRPVTDTVASGDEHALSTLALDEVAATPLAKPIVRNNVREDIISNSVVAIQAPGLVISENSKIVSTMNKESVGRNDSGSSAEIERLNSECLELEDQVSALKIEVQSAWTAYQRAQEQSKARETEFQEELKVCKSSEHAAVCAAQEAEKALLQAQEEKSDVDGSALQKQVLLQRELQLKWDAKEVALVAEVAALKSRPAQGDEALQADLRSAVEGAERLRLEHATLIRQSQRRQAELEKANAELSAGLAEARKELQLCQQQTSSTSGANFAAEEQLASLRQELKRAHAELFDERNAREALNKRLHASEAELRVAIAAVDDERARVLVTATAHARAIAALQEQLTTAERSINASKVSGSGTITDDIRGLQNQVQNLSQQLLRKQQLVLDLQAERSALKSRLQDAQAKVALAERLTQHSETGSYAYEEDDDLSSAIEGGVVRSSMLRRGRNVMQSGFNNSKDASDDVSSVIEKFGVKTPAVIRVAKAVDVVDALTLHVGRTLRAHPLARVGFVAYLILLHIWVFVILAMHIHSLDDGRNGLENLVSNSGPQIMSRGA